MIAQVPQVPDQSKVGEHPHLIMGGKVRFYMYVPHSDVTVSELAEIVGFIPVGLAVLAKALPPQTLDMFFEAMSEGAQRHFQVKEKSSIVVPGGNGAGYVK